MNAKQYAALTVAIVGQTITMWKGPGAWSTAATIATVVCLLLLPILARLAKTSPKVADAQEYVQEYVQDLEDELEHVSAPRLAALKVKHGKTLN